MGKLEHIFELKFKVLKSEARFSTDILIAFFQIKFSININLRQQNFQETSAIRNPYYLLIKKNVD